MKNFLYGRVSTGRQADNDLSVPDQIDRMKVWCNQNNYQIVGEFKDEGLSGTDENRPEFQRMLAEACVTPSPVDAIVVYNLSRIFRNHLKLGALMVELKKHRVRLISITQLTQEDAAGELMRSQFALFDEYQSKQNGANTLRCMLKNAERGFFNGSSVPFGYRIHETTEPARSGFKKLLIVNPEESPVVKQIFDLYIERNIGLKGVASYLNEKKILRRGEYWSTCTINLILTNTVYKGEKRFNQRDWRTGQAKEESEVVIIPVEPIVSEDVFELARYKRQQRSPKRSHPKRLASPRLLTGLLKCGECGAAMTMATGTGEGGTYAYYRCTTKTKKHLGLCSSKPVAMARFDKAILNALADKVFTPERVSVILKELKQRMSKDSGMDINDLNKQLKVVQHKIHQLYDAIETGCVSLDEDTKARMDDHKSKRAELAAKVANYQLSPKMLVDTIDPEEVKRWSELLREKLLDTTSGFPKEYLQLLIKEIVLTGKEVRVSGDSRALVGAIRFAAETKNPITSKKVIGFNDVWRAWSDSNARPTDS